MSREQIIDEVYENYVKSFFKGELKKNYEGGGYDIDDYYYSTKFSETWGLKIEEREILKQIDQTNPILKGSTTLVPTKLITITYNNETIESYE